MAERLHTPLPAGRGQLDVRLERARPESFRAVIAPPHPVHGGSMDHPVVRALERMLVASGASTLCFDFRELAAGEEEPRCEDALEDLLTVARFDARPPRLLAGYSYGAVVALEAALVLGVERVLMVAPPVALCDPALFTRGGGDLTIVCGSEDEYAPAAYYRERVAARANSCVIEVEGAGHLFSGSELTRLTDALASWMKP